ncbi:MAG: hypothetical protein GF317_12435 [Candidatus Lokiarchaeota archaeon]|nr:hypothetical protein [Candidatus Lokiarchaeota archaeon]MBD3200454.1 hypothetical protein [Candidatus Lokiarchaeota archaeon]
MIVAKILTSCYLGYKIWERNEKTGKISFGFVFSLYIMMICLFVSRIFYFTFDFYFTNLNPSLYQIFPNVWFWKIAVVISAFGYSFVLFIIDRSILDFKFKGVLSYMMFTVALIIFFYPVNTSSDFELVSTLLFLINIIAIAIPVLFFYIGYHEADFRNPSVLIAIGVIIYAVGANVLIESVVSLLDSLLPGIRIPLYTLSLFMKLIGIVIYSYGVIKFVEIFSK